MDTITTIIAAIFLALLSAVIILFLKDSPAQKQEKPATPEKKDNQEYTLRKKTIVLEEKIKTLEENLKNSSYELEQAKELSKKLINEQSKISFDSQQYEKFKEDHKALKHELTKKEETTEKEISLRLKQSNELLQLKQDSDSLKKRSQEIDDNYRKAQATIEALTKELKGTKKTLTEQHKIVSEHSENKIAGEWVTRGEFDALEKELKEKESMIQKMLLIKKDSSS